MPLFERTADQLIEVPSTAFAAEQILERADLQRLLRAKLDMIVDGALVDSEEFGPSPTPAAGSTCSGSTGPDTSWSWG